MPTYSYQCKRCSHIQDIFHGMNAAPRIKCADCGGPCTKLLGTGSGIIFKGSGFYETDYKNKGKAPATEKKTDSAKPASEAKPAAPTASGEGKSTTAAKAG